MMIKMLCYLVDCKKNILRVIVNEFPSNIDVHIISHKHKNLEKPFEYDILL